MVISLEPKETKFKIRLALWTLVELFHKVTINSIADMFTTRIYNQEKKASKELKLKKDVTLHFFVKPIAVKIPRIILLRIHIQSLTIAIVFELI